MMNPNNYKPINAADAVSAFLEPKNPNLIKTYIPTGMPSLDKVLGGGLTSGLYCLGAVSSAGKSTFCLQLAMTAATAGVPVIIFSTEMKASDLAAKCISHQSYIDSKTYDANPLSYQDVFDINQHPEIPAWNKMINTISSVKKALQHITIYDSLAPCYDTDIIKELVAQYITDTCQKPIVIIDYLQNIDTPASGKSINEKQLIDYAVKNFKLLSDIHDIPVMLVSSFNRDNYDKPVSTKAFKESGKIEYAADVILGLQYRGVGSKGFNIAEAKTKHPREVELVILKQRNGESDISIPYDFYAKYNCFSEVPASPSSNPVPNNKLQTAIKTPDSIVPNPQTYKWFQPDDF